MRITLVLLSVTALLGQGTPKSLNPLVRKAVEAVSTERIEASMRKLESFGTRGNYSETDSATRGIGAARRWIHQEFQSYSPRLEVRFDTHKVKKQQRIFRDIELVNVVAVLKGTRYPDRQIIISGHYDSLNLGTRREAPATAEAGNTQAEKLAMADAPGVSDDASGVAATLELARVLSHYEFDKTIIFVAFAGEEIGLVGSSLHASQARKAGVKIEAVLNSDIIGTEVSGDGRRINRSVRVFSDDPNDSASRSLARYVKEIGERYYPSMQADLIFRHDRFGRGGDHTPFALEGFAAVRFTSAVENYKHQHSLTDTLVNASPEYTANVTRLKAGVAASLALAPAAPDATNETIVRGEKRRGASVSRGKSQYDAHLKWKDPEPAPDLSGYAVVARRTASPLWEKEVFVGKEMEYIFIGMDIDDYVFGVKAIDNQGNESLVAPYVAPPPTLRKVEMY